MTLPFTPIQACLFDLDGTLVDSLRDIAESMNAVLHRHHVPTHPVEAYNTFVGDGMIALAERAWPTELRDSSINMLDLVEEMKQEYANRWQNHSTPYPGIESMLTGCASRGMNLGVLSNKPDAFTKKMVTHFFPDIPFSIVRGAREGVPVKPDPTSAREIQQEWGLSPSSIAYIGDTDTDMKTGCSAGFTTIGVSWGFREPDELLAQGAQCVVDSPSELSQILSSRT